MTKKKIKELNKQRPFVLVYHDFLESSLIKTYEKIVFIALKKFANSKDKCFPSLKKLSEITGLSKRKVQDTLKELEEKKIISIESRTSANGGKSSNLYTLYDFKELWCAKTVEEVEEAKKNNFVNLSEVSTEMLLAELERRNKEKVLETTGKLTKLTAESSTKSNNSYQKNQFNFIPNNDNCQSFFNSTDKESQQERYTHEEIKELYDYDIMVYDEPTNQDDIDNVIEILHSTLNTTKPTIRIGGETKSTKIVISKLLKLDKDCLLYAIDKFKEQTGRIKNPKSYMLTLLYNSKEQMNLDISNKVQHDMYNNAIADNGISSNCDTQKYDMTDAEQEELQEQNYFSWTEQAKKEMNKTQQVHTSKPLNHRFNAFPQRQYTEEDYKELEKRLLRRS